MLNRRTFLIAGIVLALLGLAGFLVSTQLNTAKAGLLVQTNPQSVVYIDDKETGTTPYETVRSADEITIRLVPVATSGSLAPWGTKLSLVEGIQTVIRRDFGPTEIESQGEVLSFEKISGNNSSLTIVSSPDASQVTFDGEIRGFTPLPIESVIPGSHTIIVSQPGFAERTISAKTESGYKLTVVAMLAQLPKAQEVVEATNSGQVAGQTTGPKVEILETPTGFLRVRASATTASSESGQVKPGEEYSLLEENTGGSWFKIEFLPGKQGWISSQYAKKIE